MGFEVKFGSLLLPARTPRSLAFYRAECNGRAGAAVVVARGSEARAFFYPAALIEEKIGKIGGRKGYVYHEGFNPIRSAEAIAPLIRSDMPAWNPNLSLPQELKLNLLKISQPGVDIWRMLCLALDNGVTISDQSGPKTFIDQAPPSLVVGSASQGTVLLAGNHRALFLLGSGIDTINAVSLTVPGRAFQYTESLGRSVEHVKGRFGSDGVLSLEKSFIEQLELLEAA